MGRWFNAVALLLGCSGLAAPVNAQQVLNTRRLAGCQPKTAIEFISPMLGEEVANFHGPSPSPDSWHVVLEIAVEQSPGIQITRVLEGAFLPSPGKAAVPPTDVDANAIIGDPHPAIPGLVVTIDDDLLYNGFLLPAGTNLASFFELIGSEIEHGGDQSTSLAWIVDPLFALIDLNGDMGTNIAATINNALDTVFVRHGWDPAFQGVLSVQTPTISIWTSDWISTVDSDVPPGMQTHFLVCVEVRIPCTFDHSTTPPTPVPLDPLFGPCFGGGMACTGNFGPFPGPGFNPAFPSFDVRFSDSYFDPTTGSFVPGGTISGGQCGVIWHATGGSLAFAFRQSSVSAWYGVNGVPDTAPGGGGDDQMIYRFIMPASGHILDTDAMPQEMLITAAVETTSNCFSITNVRVKHRPNVFTPNPLP